VTYNAPIVAFGVEANDINFPTGGVDYSKMHDQVLAIDPINMTVTLNLISFIATNGPEIGGCDNPLRQGLSADLADGARPNNVLGGIPTIATDYSPIWDAQLFQWTQNAISQGFRGQVREEFQILTFVQDGLITGPGGGKFGSSGFSINCPIAQRLD